MERVKICICSHMRKVVLDEENGEVGWYHVSSTGMLEHATQPCQAAIYRFEVEVPHDSFTLGNTVPEDEDLTFNERYPR